MGSCVGDAEGEHWGNVGDVTTAGGLGDTDDGEDGGLGGDPVVCTCCCDWTGVELSAKCTAGSDAGMGSAGECDGDEASAVAGDCSNEEPAGETGDSTGRSRVDSGLSTGENTSGPWLSFPSSLGAHCA